MKTYVIRCEKTQIGYFSFKCRSINEAKAQAKYQMAVNPKQTIQFDKCEEVKIPKPYIIDEDYKQLEKDWLEEK